MCHSLHALGVCMPVSLVLTRALHSILPHISILHKPNLYAWLGPLRTLVLHFHETPLTGLLPLVTRCSPSTFLLAISVSVLLSAC